MRNSWLRGELCVMWWPRWSKKKQKKEAARKGLMKRKANRATTNEELLKGGKRGRMKKD